MCKISIIIPIFNAEQYLKESIESILHQSFSDFELILVNDGSTDRSKEICEFYCSSDKRIHLINSTNCGSGIARNKGINIATGEYCYFPDADDILLADTLKLMNEEINNKDADLYVFGYILARRNLRKEFLLPRTNLYIHGEEIRKQYENYMREGLTYIQGAPWNKLFKTQNIKDNHIEYPNLRRNQDDVFIFRYMSTVKSVKFCDKYIYKYYENDLKKQFEKFPKDYFDIRTKWYQEYKNYLIKWNSENIRALGSLTFSYIAYVLKCFEYMFSPKWEMNKNSRKKYIETCINNNEVKLALNFLIQNKKCIQKYLKESNTKTFIIILIYFQAKLMKHQKITSLYIISRLVTIIREIYKKVIYR